MQDLITRLSEQLRNKGLKLATAESCTGGMIGAALTNLPGSSDIYEGGFITYSNDLKISALGVKFDTLQEHGAVSEQAAGEMAIGALEKTGADISIAVTGIAGPGGATDDKPVGLVYIAILFKGHAPRVHQHIFEGNRDDVRKQTVKVALMHVMGDLLEEAH